MRAKGTSLNNAKVFNIFYLFLMMQCLVDLKQFFQLVIAL